MPDLHTAEKCGGGKISGNLIGLIELSPRKNVEPRIVGIRSTFRGSTFFRLVKIRLKSRETVSWITKLVKIPGDVPPARVYFFKLLV